LKRCARSYSESREAKTLPKAASKGDIQELRLARLLFAEGAFVRRAIDLNLSFGEDITVTDLDVWALAFAPDLSTTLTIGESKAIQGKKGAKVADRLLWIRGLSHLVEADQTLVVSASGANDRQRGLAQKMGVALLGQRDLAHREGVLGLDGSSPWGPHDPELLTRQRSAYEALKADPELKRVYWFLRSEFWLVPPTTGLKRGLGALRIIRRRWTGRADQPGREVLLWLSRQAQVNVVVAVSRLAGRFYRSDPAVVRQRLIEELAAGPDVDYGTLTQWAQTADKYLMGVLDRAGVDPGQRVEALGALMPTPPGYTESLVEVLERLAQEPAITANLARLADWKLAEVELGEDLGPLPGRPVAVDDGSRMLRLLGAFLAGQIDVPEEMLAGILSAASPPRPSGRAADERPEPVVEETPGSHEEVSETLFDDDAARAVGRK
jgi:hypothetical protein